MFFNARSKIGYFHEDWNRKTKQKLSKVKFKSAKVNISRLLDFRSFWPKQMERC